MKWHDLPHLGASLAPAIAGGHGAARPPAAAPEAFARVEPALAHRGRQAGGREAAATPGAQARARAEPP
eukprot:11212291-Lingulodinium_polyedra.AAC.1